MKRSNANLKGVEYPTFVGWVKEFTPKYNQRELNEVVSVERELRPATVYDVEVDGDHLFCLANGIQTHNSLVGAVLLAVNASEFFTQDVEDMHFNVTAVARKAGADLDEEIRAACRALGKTEEKLSGWLRKKYGADGIGQLTDEDRREVLTLLRGMLSKRAA